MWAVVLAAVKRLRPPYMASCEKMKFAVESAVPPKRLTNLQAASPFLLRPERASRRRPRAPHHTQQWAAARAEKTSKRRTNSSRPRHSKSSNSSPTSPH